MKNKIIYAIGWVLLLIVSGCSDWLSVSPRTEKPTEQLFETQNGFRDALTGAYIEMMSDKSYGEYLTMSKIEYLVDFWDPEKGSGEEALTLHRYSDAQAVTMIDALYEQQYKVILAVNAILEYVDLRQAIFDPGAYEASQEQGAQHHGNQDLDGGVDVALAASVAERGGQVGTGAGHGAVGLAGHRLYGVGHLVEHLLHREFLLKILDC